MYSSSLLHDEGDGDGFMTVACGVLVVLIPIPPLGENFPTPG